MKVKYRCDVPMAKKKNIRRNCDKKCWHCLCAIRTNASGSVEHIPDMRSPCANFTLRNLNVMSGRDRDGK